MMKKYLILAGGVLTAVSAFLPFVKFMDHSATLMEFRDSAAYIFIVLGAIIAIVGLVGKRWLHILSLLLGLGVAALAVNYMNDAKGLGAEAGIAIWLQMVAGAITIVGSILGLMKPKTA